MTTQLAPFRVKGFAWLNLLACAKENFGDWAVTQLAKAFPAHAQHFVPGAVSAVGWVPGELHLGAIEELVKTHLGGTPAGAQELGRLLSSRNVDRTFRSIKDLSDLNLALLSTQRAFGQFYSRGVMAFTVEGPVLTARLTDFPGASLLLGHSLGAGLVTFLKASGVPAQLTRVTVVDASMSYEIALTLPA